MKKILFIALAGIFLAGCKTNISTTGQTNNGVQSPAPETTQSADQIQASPMAKDDGLTDLNADLNSTTIVQEDFN
ncbi:MAG: hypothetical protein ABI758_05030 [Candidatus Woesebacteria bacterium]